MGLFRLSRDREVQADADLEPELLQPIGCFFGLEVLPPTERFLATASRHPRRNQGGGGIRWLWFETLEHLRR